MLQQSLSRQENRRIYRPGAYLFIIVAWLPVLLLSISFMTKLRALYAQLSSIGSREIVQLVAEDEQFRIYVSDEHLTAEEAAWLLQESNRARVLLVEFLKLEYSGKQITIRVYPYGQSQARIESDSIRLAGNAWRTSILHHELTHVLAGWSSFAFRKEGVAVLAESRVMGNLLPYPWWTLEATSVAMVETVGFLGLEQMDKPGEIHVPPPSQRIARATFYLLAGSFTGYLVDAYGWDKYWELYQDGQYEEVYGRTLTDLEQEWLAQLATYKRIRYAPLALLGLLCVALLAWAARQPAPWRRALAVGTPGILAAASAIVPAPFPVLAAILLGLLGLLLGRQQVVERWPRGVWWTAIIVGTTLVIGLIIVPGWNVVLRYA